MENEWVVFPLVETYHLGDTGEQLLKVSFDPRLHGIPAKDHLEELFLDPRTNRKICSFHEFFVEVLPAIDGWAYAIAMHPKERSVAVGGTNGQIRRIKLRSD